MKSVQINDKSSFERFCYHHLTPKVGFYFIADRKNWIYGKHKKSVSRKVWFSFFTASRRFERLIKTASIAFAFIPVESRKILLKTLLHVFLKFLLELWLNAKQVVKTNQAFHRARLIIFSEETMNQTTEYLRKR